MVVDVGLDFELTNAAQLEKVEKGDGVQCFFSHFSHL